MAKKTQLELDMQYLLEKAKSENTRIIDRASLGKKEKISNLVIEMIKPILYTAQDEEDAKGIISMGVTAWNCGVIKQTFGEKKLREMMKEFKSKDYPEERKLLDEYIQVKCTRYSDYNEFIVDFKISIEPDGHLNFTVVTDVTREMGEI